MNEQDAALFASSNQARAAQAQIAAAQAAAAAIKVEQQASTQKKVQRKRTKKPNKHGGTRRPQQNAGAGAAAPVVVGGVVDTTHANANTRAYSRVAEMSNTQAQTKQALAAAQASKDLSSVRSKLRTRVSGGAIERTARAEPSAADTPAKSASAPATAASSGATSSIAAAKSSKHSAAAARLGRAQDIWQEQSTAAAAAVMTNCAEAFEDAVSAGHLGYDTAVAATALFAQAAMQCGEVRAALKQCDVCFRQVLGPWSHDSQAATIVVPAALSTPAGRAAAAPKDLEKLRSAARCATTTLQILKWAEALCASIGSFDTQQEHADRRQRMSAKWAANGFTVSEHKVELSAGTQAKVHAPPNMPLATPPALVAALSGSSLQEALAALSDSDSDLSDPVIPAIADSEAKPAAPAPQSRASVQSQRQQQPVARLPGRQGAKAQQKQKQQQKSSTQAGAAAGEPAKTKSKQSGKGRSKKPKDKATAGAQGAGAKAPKAAAPAPAPAPAPKAAAPAPAPAPAPKAAAPAPIAKERLDELKSKRVQPTQDTQFGRLVDDSVQSLLSHNPQVRMQAGQKVTMLLNAAFLHGNAEAQQALLCGDSVTGSTVLLAAASAGNTVLVQSILNRCSKAQGVLAVLLNGTNSALLVPAAAAALKHFSEVVQLLLVAGASCKLLLAAPAVRSLEEASSAVELPGLLATTTQTEIVQWFNERSSGGQSSLFLTGDVRRVHQMPQQAMGGYPQQQPHPPHGMSMGPVAGGFGYYHPPAGHQQQWLHRQPVQQVFHAAHAGHPQGAMPPPVPGYGAPARGAAFIPATHAAAGGSFPPAHVAAPSVPVSSAATPSSAAGTPAVQASSAAPSKTRAGYAAAAAKPAATVSQEDQLDGLMQAAAASEAAAAKAAAQKSEVQAAEYARAEAVRAAAASGGSGKQLGKQRRKPRTTKDASMGLWDGEAHLGAEASTRNAAAGSWAARAAASTKQ